MTYRRHLSSETKEKPIEMIRTTNSQRFFRWSPFSFRWKKFISTPQKFFFIVGIFIVIINEYLVYEFSRWNWPKLDQLVTNPNIDRILLIADPQLIGEKDEGFFGFITRTDADRYLSKSFSRVNDYIRPDWTIFLGDIFDEGLSASDDEFKRYFDRFDEIFHYETHEHRCIVIPGDNDVGGEYYGDKQPILRQRFRNYFGKTISLYRQNNIEFLKLDVDMLESYVDGKRFAIMEETNNRPMTATFRLILNHWPLLTRSARFVRPFINELEPNLILKGDSHHFNIISYDRKNSTSRYIAREILPQPIFSINLSVKDTIYEISIPTCSYRMGVQRMGYGVLLLDSDLKMAHLLILSSPHRYFCLFLYIGYVVFAFISLLILSIIPRRTLTRLFKDI